MGWLEMQTQPRPAMAVGSFMLQSVALRVPNLSCGGRLPDGWHDEQEDASSCVSGAGRHIH